MKSLIGAPLLSLFLLASCQGGEGQKEVASRKMMVWGVGATSCGEYIGSLEKDPRMESLYGQWLHGYISGLNQLDGDGADNAASVDRAGLMTWMKGYCVKNPLDDFALGAHALVQELKFKQRPARVGDL